MHRGGSQLTRCTYVPTCDSVVHFSGYFSSNFKTEKKKNDMLKPPLLFTWKQKTKKKTQPSGIYIAFLSQCNSVGLSQASLWQPPPPATTLNPAPFFPSSGFICLCSLQFHSVKIRAKCEAAWSREQVGCGERKDGTPRQKTETIRAVWGSSSLAVSVKQHDTKGEKTAYRVFTQMDR